MSEKTAMVILEALRVGLRCALENCIDALEDDDDSDCRKIGQAITLVEKYLGREEQ